MDFVVTRVSASQVSFFNDFNLQANTHINVHQDLKDVKLWEVGIITLNALAVSVISIFQDNNNYVFFQVHTLLKGLEKIAVSADIPMLVCGDFNSIPGRFVRY